MFVLRKGAYTKRVRQISNQSRVSALDQMTWWVIKPRDQFSCCCLLRAVAPVFWKLREVKN